MKRGEVYWADIVPRSGSEQSGRRPVVLVSHDSFNRTPGWSSLIVIPCTSAPGKSARRPTEVEIPSGTAGLHRTSIVLCHQITTLDRPKVGERIGELPAPLLARIAEALKIAVDVE